MRSSNGATAIEDSPQARERLESFSRMTGLPMDEVLARADPPDFATVLSEHGWTAEHVSITALQKRYGRTLSLDPSEPAPAGTRGGLVRARRPPRFRAAVAPPPIDPTLR